MAARIDNALDPAGQTQFLTVISRDEATARFRQHLRLAPLGRETVPLAEFAVERYPSSSNAKVMLAAARERAAQSD